MAYVSTTQPNTFYIAANIIFDIATGDTRSVLMLVNKPEDASIFSATDAQKYINFVKVRAQKIIWEVEPLPSTDTPDLFRRALGVHTAATDRFIIKGVQYV